MAEDEPIIMEGRFTQKEGHCAVLHGNWAMTQNDYTEGFVAPFSYNCNTNSVNLRFPGLPPDDSYHGSFELVNEEGLKEFINENVSHLYFGAKEISDPDAKYTIRIDGSGTNRFGKFTVQGSFCPDTKKFDVKKWYLSPVADDRIDDYPQQQQQQQMHDVSSMDHASLGHHIRNTDPYANNSNRNELNISQGTKFGMDLSSQRFVSQHVMDPNGRKRSNSDSSNSYHEYKQHCENLITQVERLDSYEEKMFDFQGVRARVRKGAYKKQHGFTDAIKRVIEKVRKKEEEHQNEKFFRATEVLEEFKKLLKNFRSDMNHLKKQGYSDQIYPISQKKRDVIHGTHQYGYEDTRRWSSTSSSINNDAISNNYCYEDDRHQFENSSNMNRYNQGIRPSSGLKIKIDRAHATDIINLQHHPSSARSTSSRQSYVDEIQQQQFEQQLQQQQLQQQQQQQQQLLQQQQQQQQQQLQLQQQQQLKEKMRREQQRVLQQHKHSYVNQRKSESHRRPTVRSAQQNTNSSNNSNKMYQKVPVVLLLGAPCCGKGTQGKILQSALRWHYVSCGEELRKARVISANAHAIKNLARLENDPNSKSEAYVLRCRIIDELLKRQCLRACLVESNYAGLVIDGCRTVEQARAMEQTLSCIKGLPPLKIQIVVTLHVPKEIVKERTFDRWIHAPSGRIYSKTIRPPKNPGFDDVTGERLTQRSDNDMWGKRHDFYIEKLEDVQNYFVKRGALLLNVDATSTPLNVHSKVTNVINLGLYNRKIKLSLPGEAALCSRPRLAHSSALPSWNKANGGGCLILCRKPLADLIIRALAEVDETPLKLSQNTNIPTTEVSTSLRKTLAWPITQNPERLRDFLVDVASSNKNISVVQQTVQLGECLGLQSLLRESTDMSAYFGTVTGLKTFENGVQFGKISYNPNPDEPLNEPLNEHLNEHSGIVKEIEFSMDEVRTPTIDITKDMEVSFNIVSRQGKDWAVNIEIWDEKKVNILDVLENENNEIWNLEKTKNTKNDTMDKLDPKDLESTTVTTDRKLINSGHSFDLTTRLSDKHEIPKSDTMMVKNNVADETCTRNPNPDETIGVEQSSINTELTTENENLSVDGENHKNNKNNETLKSVMDDSKTIMNKEIKNNETQNTTKTMNDDTNQEITTKKLFENNGKDIQPSSNCDEKTGKTEKSKTNKEIWCGLLTFGLKLPQVVLPSGVFQAEDSGHSLNCAARELKKHLGIVLESKIWTSTTQQYLRQKQLNPKYGTLELYRDSVSQPKHRVYYILLPEAKDAIVSVLYDKDGRRIIRISTKHPASSSTVTSTKSRSTIKKNEKQPNWVVKTVDGVHFFYNMHKKVFVSHTLPQEWIAAGWQIACQSAGTMLYWFNKISQESEWRAGDNAKSPPGFEPHPDHKEVKIPN